MKYQGYVGIMVNISESITVIHCDFPEATMFGITVGNWGCQNHGDSP
jgi:hypothetical protein